MDMFELELFDDDTQTQETSDIFKIDIVKTYDKTTGGSKWKSATLLEIGDMVYANNRWYKITAIINKEEKLERLLKISSEEYWGIAG